LDHCINEHEVIDPWALEILEKFPNAYVELTPSGKGFHIWCFGRPLNPGKQKKWINPNTGIETGFEIYNYESPRYFTVTGDKL
jgi:primase-polymerase (primpol)-like protein